MNTARLTSLIFGLSLVAWAGPNQTATVVRMEMADCVSTHRGFVETLSGAPSRSSGELCPEYTLVSQRVVYDIVAKSSTPILPLDEPMVFRLEKNEVLIRIDDARRETRFGIRRMMLRADWEREHAEIAAHEEMMNRARLPQPPSQD